MGGARARPDRASRCHWARSTRDPRRLRPQLVKAAVQRGVVFEISYAPLVSDVSGRRQLLSNAIALVRACGAPSAKGSGGPCSVQLRTPTHAHLLAATHCRCAGGVALVSSGALSPSDMRPPADVANLGTLFGLSAGEAGKGPPPPPA